MSEARKFSTFDLQLHPEDVELSKEVFMSLTGLFYELAGVSLPWNEKNEALVKNRILKILRKRGLRSFSDYWAHLKRREPDMVSEFISALTTNMTSFFRESAHFDWMKEYLKNHFAKQRDLRVWCAAASTGQEPYTISIVLNEYLNDSQLSQVKFLATDIDLQVLDKGAKGIYAEKEMSGLSDLLRQKYFDKKKAGSETYYRAKESIHRLIRFAPMNLVQQDYGFKSQFDLIICRNVLIYFDQPTTAKVIDQLVKNLKVGGHLILGHSESGNVKHPCLRPLSKAIYQKEKDHHG